MDILLSGAIGLATAIIGILIGAWVTRRQHRARPAILVDQLTFSNPANSRDDIIPNIPLISDLQNEPFIEGNLKRGALVPENEYVEQLKSALKQLDDLINYVLPSAKNAGEELRRELAADDYVSLEKVWSQHQRDIWRLLAEAINFDDFHYTTVAPSNQTPKLPRPARFNPSKNAQTVSPGVNPVVEPDSYNPIDFDSNSRFLSVRVSDDMRIYFDLSRFEGPKEEVGKEFAARTAKALWYSYRPDIAEAVNFLWNAQEKYETRLRTLRQAIGQELEKHQRLLIQGQVNNTGGSTFSVTNKCKAFIKRDGYAYTYTDGNGNRQEVKYRHDVHIDVLLGDAQKASDPKSDAYDSPIPIAPGEVKRFVAVSKQRIKEIDQRGGVRRAFEGAQQPFYLGVLTVPSTGEKPLPEYSEVQQFRNWEKETDIPPKQS